MSRSFYYGTDAALASGAMNFSNKIGGTPTAYGLTAAQSTAYMSVNMNYQNAYDVAITPATRTRSAIATKDLARKALKDMTADLAKIIDGTATVTDAMKIELGLNVRKIPSPIPAPTERPGMDLISVVGRTVSVHIHDSASVVKRGKPAGAVAAWVYSFVGENYPSDPAEWSFDGATTKAEHQITFDNDVAGGTPVWICAAWINAKQQAGPPSTPILTHLQGGGAASPEALKIAA